MPAASAVLNTMADYGGGFFEQYGLAVAGFVLGLVVAALAIGWIKRSGGRFLKSIFNKKRY